MTIKRRCFFSFRYDLDAWRAAQVRNMGVVEENEPVSDNDWESIRKGSGKAIARWINQQLMGTSCTIVLIGSQTAGRRWINYEIKQSWKRGNGLLGIRIHKLTDQNGEQTVKGESPFRYIRVNGSYLSENGSYLSEIVKVYDPPYQTSKYVYAHIRDNLSQWVELAIRTR